MLAGSKGKVAPPPLPSASSSDVKKQGMSPAELESAMLRAIDKSVSGSIDSSRSFARDVGVDHEAVVGVSLSLCADEFITSAPGPVQTIWSLNAEGLAHVEAGASPEGRVFGAVLAAGEEGMTRAELNTAVGPDVVKVGCGKALAAKWLLMDKPTGKLKPKVDTIVDQVYLDLKSIKDSVEVPAARLKDLKKRKMVSETKLKSFKYGKGPKFALERTKAVADLTKAMLESGAWKDASFKPLNFDAMGAPVGGGYLHTLLKVRTEFRKVLLEMGFAEMPTNRFVESSFWNFDSLFQPQSHPARDAHDTFFLSKPASTRTWPEDYKERVKKMHEEGGSGSRGYRYDWKEAEAGRNLLRTHTTAVSARMLYKLAQDTKKRGFFKPVRYFSIDRVFRNEALDATHLAEFHQVEGLVAAKELSLQDLIGTIHEFFRRIGIDRLRFKPAYNPYTEPSMEIFGYHKGLGKWTEIGNSGMFRPEMLAPMGLPSDVRVIAWGLSLERPTMIKYGYKNIRDLFGHKVPFDLARKTGIVRFP